MSASSRDDIERLCRTLARLPVGEGGYSEEVLRAIAAEYPDVTEATRRRAMALIPEAYDLLRMALPRMFP